MMNLSGSEAQGSLRGVVKMFYPACDMTVNGLPSDLLLRSTLRSLNCCTVH